MSLEGVEALGSGGGTLVSDVDAGSGTTPLAVAAAAAADWPWDAELAFTFE